MAAYVGAIVAIIGAAVSYDQGEKRAAEQKEAQEISSAQQQREAMRSRRREARKSRIQRAKLLQASENTGVAESSGVSGGLASIAGQQAQANSYLSGQEVAATAISSRNQKAADYGFRAGVAQQAGQALASIDYKTIFDG